MTIDTSGDEYPFTMPAQAMQYEATPENLLVKQVKKIVCLIEAEAVFWIFSNSLCQ